MCLFRFYFFSSDFRIESNWNWLKSYFIPQKEQKKKEKIGKKRVREKTIERQLNPLKVYWHTSRVWAVSYIHGALNNQTLRRK